MSTQRKQKGTHGGTQASGEQSSLVLVNAERCSNHCKLSWLIPLFNKMTLAQIPCFHLPTSCKLQYCYEVIVLFQLYLVPSELLGAILAVKPAEALLLNTSVTTRICAHTLH